MPNNEDSYTERRSCVTEMEVVCLRHTSDTVNNNNNNIGIYNNIDHHRAVKASSTSGDDVSTTPNHLPIVIQRQLSDNNKSWPLPPRKRWVPHGFEINTNGNTVWTTDVTINGVTATIRESNDGSFTPQC